jgi:hypothetical protein
LILIGWRHIQPGFCTLETSFETLYEQLMELMCRPLST